MQMITLLYQSFRSVDLWLSRFWAQFLIVKTAQRVLTRAKAIGGPNFPLSSSFLSKSIRNFFTKQCQAHFFDLCFSLIAPFLEFLSRFSWVWVFGCFQKKRKCINEWKETNELGAIIQAFLLMNWSLMSTQSWLQLQRIRKEAAFYLPQERSCD